MHVHDAISIVDLRQLARRRLPRIVFECIESGVEYEYGSRTQPCGVPHQLLPRHLVDVSVRTQATMLFGRDYASPFGIAPTEIAALFRREADLMLAEAAALARVPLHHVWLGLRRDRTRRQVAPDNTWHQFYPVRDPAIT